MIFLLFILFIHFLFVRIIIATRESDAETMIITRFCQFPAFLLMMKPDSG